MANSLLILLDDIATVLDDVAVQTKIAAKRTAGVLSDDLAVNVEQVSGVRADRELSVIWSVAKGSAKNKLILVPVALVLAAFAEFLILPLLMLGGCYLCYEGIEKVLGKYMHQQEETATKPAVINALIEPNNSSPQTSAEAHLAALEQQQIKGAIRTDFVLSTEIIVISLGTVRDATLLTQSGVLIAIAAMMTVGVYGLVAIIIRLDDFGMLVVKRSGNSKFLRWSGNAILSFAPRLMRGLGIIGTVAMFFVGGDILARGIPSLEGLFHLLTEPIATTLGGSIELVMSLLLHTLLGMIVGVCLIPLVKAGHLLYDRIKRMTG